MTESAEQFNAAVHPALPSLLQLGEKALERSSWENIHEFSPSIARATGMYIADLRLSGMFIHPYPQGSIPEISETGLEVALPQQNAYILANLIQISTQEALCGNILWTPEFADPALMPLLAVAGGIAYGLALENGIAPAEATGLEPVSPRVIQRRGQQTISGLLFIGGDILFHKDMTSLRYAGAPREYFDTDTLQKYFTWLNTLIGRAMQFQNEQQGGKKDKRDQYKDAYLSVLNALLLRFSPPQTSTTDSQTIGRPLQDESPLAGWLKANGYIS